METCSLNEADESDGEYSEDDFDAYYHPMEYGDTEETLTPGDADDPELFPVDCLTVDQVEAFLAETVATVSDILHIDTSLTKLLLHINNWDVNKVISEYQEDASVFLAASRIIPPLQVSVESQNDENCDANNETEAEIGKQKFSCPVCTCMASYKDGLSLRCHHVFCIECWTTHVKVKIGEGLSTEITCMAQNCDLVVLEDLIMRLPLANYLRLQYRQFAFHNYVRSHSQLRFCIGPNCTVIFKAEEPLAKRVTCPRCDSCFCFKCGDNYHAPTDCVTIKNWLTKCADDSETANYFSAHTKDCPSCNICIEKNGGCNHMQCYKCRHDFCWMCLGDWKGHGSEYYECSRYKENPDSANESAKARAALRKYLHYYERWQNHAKSLKLEEKTLEKIKDRINQKVMNGSGTWIDWQYLLDAATLLAKCRYTLQYTYPYAYYMNQESKDLFEYQQGRLEAEIENLSWKVERAETTDRGDLENQMYIAEKRRKTLLKDFFQT
jgi:ariadne-2